MSLSTQELDSSWCPVCDRQIIPKRYQIPINPPSPPTPPPPPSSPRRTLRQKQGGLVQGTGRLRPNGTIKRADPQQKSQQPATKPQVPVRHRTVIDQGPIPLYCSDKCQMADINSNSQYGLPLNYDPQRESPLEASSVSAFNASSSEIESDTTGSSVESSSSASSSGTTYMSPSIAKIAEMYNFPPIPPPAPVFEEDSSSDNSYYPNEYNSGIMMAGRFIQSLCPKPAKPQVGAYRQPVERRKAIPGWTDGSNAWRASVYSFSAPKNAQDPLHRDSKAYHSFAASPHRSRGVTSSLSEPSNSSVRLAASMPSPNQELLTKFSEPFSRRCDSRVSLHSSSPTSSRGIPSSTPNTKRVRSLVMPGAEGKLLVPNVTMKAHSGSSTSLSSGWSGPTTPSSRRSARSPLSVAGDCQEADEEIEQDHAVQKEHIQAKLVPRPTKRPVVETRSWSYDNLKTYPIMQLPPKTEKRMQKQIVDGVEVEVEVEVVVEEPRKRLFLFPAPIRPTS